MSATVGINAQLSKIAQDIRMLCHDQEFGEPRGKDQIGSSAMPFKENPMMFERACSLSRNAVALGGVPAQTAAAQWFERSLDDSASRRSVLPETFLGADATCKIALAAIPGLRVHLNVIEKNVNEILPFMAVELMMLEMVDHGGDRQAAHETIRKLAFKAKDNIRAGKPNNFIELICSNEEIPADIRNAFKGKVLNPRDYVGIAVQQTEEMCASIDKFLIERGFDKSQVQRVVLNV